MVPNMLPAQPAGNSMKTPAPRTDTAIPSDAARQVSDRVSAFLTSDAAMETSGRRPKGTPPEGGMVPGGAGGPRQSEAASESETALLLLESDGEAESDGVDADTGSPTASIVFDEAKNYYPTSLY